jgi:hypothetical protein
MLTKATNEAKSFAKSMNEVIDNSACLIATDKKNDIDAGSFQDAEELFKLMNRDHHVV